MLKNKLFTDEQREDQLRCTGHVNPYRCSGRTTGLALFTIGQAMGRPGAWVYPPRDTPPGARHREHLILQMRLLTDRLGLRFFDFDVYANRIRYSIFEEA